MSFSSTGLLAGAPAQAGQWTIPVTVTDSATPPNTANGTLPLTVGLATAYASSYGTCNMPTPATPLYYPGAASWTADTSALGPYSGEIHILNGNVLTGCLNGGFSSGIYALNLTAYAGANGTGAALQTVSMNLPVVAQDTLDNGTVTISATGNNLLPPNDYLQGVVTPGLSFQAVVGSGTTPFGVDNPDTTAGNFLFGLETGALHVLCSGAETPPLSLTAPSPGRFDLLFNWAGQTCPSSPPAAFPSTPATLTFASVDAIGSTVSVGNATVSNVSVSASGITNTVKNVLEIPSGQPGTTIPITLTFDYNVQSTSTAFYQIEFGLNTDSGPQQAFQNGRTGGFSGTAGSVSLSVPNIPGRYYVGMDRSAYFDYSVPSPIPNWWDGPPNATRYIAIVDVLGPGLG
jgi:hypothetical protein